VGRKDDEDSTEYGKRSRSRDWDETAIAER
jgi:hypothetical protein